MSKSGNYHLVNTAFKGNISALPISKRALKRKQKQVEFDKMKRLVQNLTQNNNLDNNSVFFS